MQLTHIPLNIKGMVFSSTMPNVFPENTEEISALKAAQISHVILLCSDVECRMYTGLNLRELYQNENMKVVHFPIPDFGVPPLQELVELIDQILEIGSDPHNRILIHCRAGRGRTGMVLACLVRKANGGSGIDAIDWVRRIIPGAVETEGQARCVNRFLEEKGQK